MSPDEARERRIDEYRECLNQSLTRGEKYYWWALMRNEIMARSPEQVAKMEKECGLEVV